MLGSLFFLSHNHSTKYFMKLIFILNSFNLFSLTYIYDVKKYIPNTSLGRNLKNISLLDISLVPPKKKSKIVSSF